MTQPDESSASDNLDQQISSTEAQLAQLTEQLQDAKRTVQEWIDANSNLSQSAASARAETQSMGRGLGGALLGSKYIATRRKHAASINAQIARDVASKRARIKQRKQNAQETVRQIQAHINQLKENLKLLKSQKKAVSSKKPTQAVHESSRSLMLLEKLHEAYQMGLLTQEEYEEKRTKIVDQI